MFIPVVVIAVANHHHQCDEEKPVCKNCVQHRMKCEFQDPPARKSQLKPTLDEFSKLSSGNASDVASSPGISPKSTSSPQPRSLELDTLGFKLIHNFTTSTFRTLADHEELQSLWQNQIPELAFTHTFLLRMILAVSALHLHHKTLDTQYLPYAHQQYEESLRVSAQVLVQISSTNCDALYACSALGFIFELGTLNVHRSLLYDASGSLAHWVVHARGVRTIIDSSWRHLLSGVLKPIFHRQSLQGDSNIPKLCLDELVGYIRSTGVGDRDLSVYLVATQELVKWSKVTDVGFFGWMCQTSDEFVTLLAQKDSFALVIFAHSCVLLAYGEPRFWIGHWARGLLNEVSEWLDPSLRVWLEWPLANVQRDPC
jgi:hypothetical protein